MIFFGLEIVCWHRKTYAENAGEEYFIESCQHTQKGKLHLHQNHQNIKAKK